MIPENTTLVIEEVDLRDSGVYKVLASNDEGVAEYAFTIIVGKWSPLVRNIYSLNKRVRDADVS